MVWFLNAVLTVYANAWLAGRGQISDADLLERAPAFAAFRTLDFGAGQEFTEWLMTLRQRGFNRVWVHRPTTPPATDRLEPHRAAAFAGGIQTGLLATGDAPSALWVCELQPAESFEQARRSPRPWRLAFSEYPLPQATPIDLMLTEAASALDSALVAIEGFAVEQRMEGWSQVFASAADQLRGNDDSMLAEVQKDFPADSLSIEALRLLAACRKAWVFGGMGSWNDQMPADAARYRDLTAALYEAVCIGVCAVANTAGR